MTDLVHSGSASIPGGYDDDGATLLERAARAAALADGVLPECDSWVDYFPIARAVLMAVREPSVDMSDAIMQNFADPCWPEDAKQGFAAMIDAILTDGEEQ